ncbi:hypothetical protein HanRHA438_Chr11g0532241 [Helianthus annuus]|uniref:Uncharacterized protein n=1 Tax=Helianthus annuus TaxID=4232 RepID=A0A9K3N2L2_HELAN|nr:hypothetical protein HanXRQr2_Chr11g0520741 [Helianthus annuus]KAJ0873207.1 hypothetical protein HanRHA438_Chr11g0532241 [Helianthus annuus]KAJ0877607.1 hypothetical protein HanPSC8_Chr11g0501981 [Helianthus annuus]
MCREPQGHRRVVFHGIHFLPTSCFPLINQNLLMSSKKHVIAPLTYRKNPRNHSTNTSQTHPVNQIPFPLSVILQHPYVHPNTRYLNN